MDHISLTKVVKSPVDKLHEEETETKIIQLIDDNVETQVNNIIIPVNEFQTKSRRTGL